MSSQIGGASGSSSENIVCMENVQRYYGENPELLERYQQIVESGKCPFCGPNITNERVHETADWIAVKNQFPCKNTRIHLLILPRRHLVSPLQMSLFEWASFGQIIHFLIGMYPELEAGFGLGLRVGEIGGVTLTHLHQHLILPEIGPNGPIAVNFGIG